MTPSTYEFPDFRPGSVWLVGAGPGDPGLITRLGAHALALADAVIHDALVDPRVVALARPGATIEPMGKRGGHASPHQDQITARLIAFARQGCRVVRLKGGDPFVFGRGAEEAAALAAAGIPFRIVPGVTAGVGGLAYAGIPATARACNSAVTFITGHGAEGTLPSGVDWDSLAKGAPVLVFYMALRQLEALVARLLAAGRPPADPTAVVSRATTPHQRVIEAPLDGIVAAVAADRPDPPALLVVGRVVDLRPVLGWWTGPDAETPGPSGTAID